MKIIFKVDETQTKKTNMVLSDDEIDNNNYVSMWFESFDEDTDGEIKVDYSEEFVVSIDDLLRAASLFKKFDSCE